MLRKKEKRLRFFGGGGGTGIEEMFIFWYGPLSCIP